jgi:hypothetical protein
MSDFARILALCRARIITIPTIHMGSLQKSVLHCIPRVIRTRQALRVCPSCYTGHYRCVEPAGTAHMRVLLLIDKRIQKVINK